MLCLNAFWKIVWKYHLNILTWGKTFTCMFLMFALWFLFQITPINKCKYKAFWKVCIRTDSSNVALHASWILETILWFYSFFLRKHLSFQYVSLSPCVLKLLAGLLLPVWKKNKQTWMYNIGKTVPYVFNSCNLQCTKTFVSFGLKCLVL